MLPRSGFTSLGNAPPLQSLQWYYYLAVALVHSLQYLLYVYEMLSFVADDGDDLEAGGGVNNSPGAPSEAQTINRRNHSTLREIGKEWCKQVTDAISAFRGLSILIYGAAITFWTALFQRCKYILKNSV